MDPQSSRGWNGSDALRTPRTIDPRFSEVYPPSSHPPLFFPASRATIFN
jgi:hypothetical protein